MKIWMRLMGICFLTMFVVGCAAKERGLSPKSTYSSPEIVEKDITPKSTKVESTAQEQVVSKPRAKVTAHRLNLREKGSAKSRVLGVLKKGEILQILSKKGKWVQVHNDIGLSGWVFGRYIEPIDGISIAEAKGVKKSEKQSQPSEDRVTGSKEVSPAVPVKRTSVNKIEKAKQQPAEKQAKSDQDSKKPKAYFVKLYNDVHKAIVDGDLDTFEKLTTPPDPSAPKIAPDQFAAMKEFLVDIFPDLSSTKFKKFNADNNIAMFVLQTHLDDKKDVELTAYRFIKTDKGWKLSGKMEGESIPIKGEQDDKKTIEKVLAKNPAFQLYGSGWNDMTTKSAWF